MTEYEKEIDILLPLRRQENNNSYLVGLKTKTIIQRFLNKTEKTNTCWLYKGYRDREGYGWFKRCNHFVSAHRFSYMLNVGKIPLGMDVLHKCDIRNCVNPEHLFLGTQADNNLDRDRKGRQVIIRGEKHSLSKLKESEVLEIRQLVTQGLTQREIARKFQVHFSTIHYIVNGKLWGWLS